MTYKEKLEAGEDVDARFLEVWGPRTERGFPVELEIDVRLRNEDGKGYCLSCMGGLKMKKSDKLGLVPIETSGQCLDTASSYLKKCGLRCRMLDDIIPIWKRWHLNDTKAGSPRQEEFVRQYRKDHPDWRYEYGDACKMLKESGLYEDSQYLVGGKPYRYGTSWLFEEIPHDVLVRLCEILDDGMRIEKVETAK